MSNHAKKSALLTSTTRPAILAFCTAMDLAALQKRLQQALGQEFTVGPLLGEGGFAAVFRARDNVLNRDVVSGRGALLARSADRRAPRASAHRADLQGRPAGRNLLPHHAVHRRAVVAPIARYPEEAFCGRCRAHRAPG